jgi:hypothetical protein
LLNIGTDGLDLESIVDESANLKIDFNNILENSAVYESQSVIHKYLVTQDICKKYLSGEFEIEQVIEKLEILGDDAKFESQKILFKEFSQADNIGATRKEEIYELLNGFTSEGFWKILDIYKGRVDSIEDGIVYVKFESFSPEKVVRVEKFSVEFLRNHHILSEDAQFEYTIYVTSIGSGSSYHIEPV